MGKKKERETDKDKVKESDKKCSKRERARWIENDNAPGATHGHFQSL